MTVEQQIEYLKENGWEAKPNQLWMDGREKSYLWEQSAAVKQQQFRDRERAKGDES